MKILSDLKFVNRCSFDLLDHILFYLCFTKTFSKDTVLTSIKDLKKVLSRAGQHSHNEQQFFENYWKVLLTKSKNHYV